MIWGSDNNDAETFVPLHVNILNIARIHCPHWIGGCVGTQGDSEKRYLFPLPGTDSYNVQPIT
jgi:hypothetical protein